ncbi:MAG: GxxExxY protein [Verrucomicrobiota bacterium]|jgi:GxxExxY protein
MNISARMPLKRLTRQEFDALSRKIMAHVFASQNELGRLCDEAVYQSDIALRLQAGGLGPVATEVPLSVSLRDFTKNYRLDLVIQESFIMELKTAVALVSEHDSQLLNYLLITGAPHGKLVNLRPASVEYRTVNAAVSAAERHRYRLATERWQPQTSRCRLLPEILTEMVAAWGAFLDCHLYEEALIHFLGGEAKVLQKAPLQRNGLPLGTQTVPLVADSAAFRLTALAPEGCNAYEAHLRRFLALTPLVALHWINLHHHEIQFTTITR